MIYTLKTPIEHAGESITELELAEPTTKMVRELGLPFSLTESGMPQPITKICAAYVSKLGKIPPSAVDKLAVSDFTALTWTVVCFFGDSAQTI